MYPLKNYKATSIKWVGQPDRKKWVFLSTTFLIWFCKTPSLSPKHTLPSPFQTCMPRSLRESSIKPPDSNPLIFCCRVKVLLKWAQLSVSSTISCQIKIALNMHLLIRESWTAYKSKSPSRVRELSVIINDQNPFIRVNRFSLTEELQLLLITDFQ